jgi:hypothetical protein
VYASDIQRLEAIEEAGFLLGLGAGGDCPLCGASAENQKQTHRLSEVEKTRAAADAEIAKIERQKIDLKNMLDDLDTEGQSVREKLAESYVNLSKVEQVLANLAPEANNSKRRVEELLSTRDRVQKGMSLTNRKISLLAQREELISAKPVLNGERPKLGVSGTTADEFAQTVSEVLTEWQFPGQRRVSFDEATFDLRIDGKSRKDNGKGVRAITHAAFKVALLQFCRERSLPHPGFLVLDTPLLTYRDPLHSKDGPLSSDEREMSSTSLKDFFFKHLSSKFKNEQVIIIENIDMPAGIERIAKVEVFTGEATNGRPGLFLPAV